MTLEQRVAELEKRVAELEGRVNMRTEVTLKLDSSQAEASLERVKAMADKITASVSKALEMQQRV